MNYLKVIGVNDLDKLSVEEMFLKIREFNQFSFYTVDEDYCIQLFDKEICANDEVDCIAEFSATNVKRLLKSVIEDIAEREYCRIYDI